MSGIAGAIVSTVIHTPSEGPDVLSAASVAVAVSHVESSGRSTWVSAWTVTSPPPAGTCSEP